MRVYDARCPKENMSMLFAAVRTTNPIAHRDLSAKNVVVDSSTSAKISDLGPCNSRFLSASVRTEGTIDLYYVT